MIAFFSVNCFSNSEIPSLRSSKYMAFSDITESGVILGQNCVRLTDAALNDLFFFKFVLSKAVYICYEHRGSSSQKCPFIFFREKVPFYISAGCCL